MARPKCPNHGAEMSPTDNRRIYICPISDARFECDADSSDRTVKRDKYGNIMASYDIKAIDQE